MMELQMSQTQVILTWGASILFAAGCVASLALAIRFHKLVELARRNLDKESRTKSLTCCKYGVFILSVALMSLPLQTELQLIPSAVCWALALPVVAWGVVISMYSVRSTGFGTPEGQPGDYDLIAAEFALVTPITTDAEYEAADAFYRRKYERDRLAEECGSSNGRITVPQWRFMHQVQDAVWAYKRSKPRLLCGQEWYDARKQQISLVEQTIASARQLRDSKGLCNKGSEALLRWADTPFFGLQHLKRILEGAPEAETDPLRLRTDDYELNHMERKLDKLVDRVQEALRLYQAEADGTLLYPTPVWVLLLQAAREHEDFSRAAAALEQAVAQARGPDAGGKPGDLAVALRSLGEIRLVHLDQAEQAERAFREALPLFERQYGTESREVAYVLGRIASALAAQKNYDEAERHARLALAMQRKHLPHGLPEVCRMQRQLAGHLRAQNKMDDVTRLLQEQLKTCEPYARDLLNSLWLESALDQLIAHYLQVGRPADAAALTLRVMKEQKDALGRKSPEELRNYAAAMGHAGRLDQQKELQLKAEERQRAYDELEKRPFFGRWNVLEQDLIIKAMLEDV